MSKLEDCINRVEKDLAKDIASIETEAYVIQRLGEPEEIKQFCSAYQKAYTESLQRQADRGEDNEASQLIRKGYNAEDVAIYLIRGNLAHTMSHLPGVENVSIWFEHMPYYADEFDGKVKKIREAYDKL